MNSTLTKIDDCLSWIEREVAFETKVEARETLKEILSKAKIKIFKLPKQEERVTYSKGQALKL